MSLNCNLDLMCGSGSGLGDFIFLLPFWGNNLNAYYKDFVPAPTTFKRASAANQVDDLGLTPVAIDVPKLNKGITLEGTATNKVTAAKNNPLATTNITKGGDAASVLSVVADATNLSDVGLQEYGPNVYKLDNSAGTTAATATFGGQVGNTNKHTISVIIRSTATTTLSLGTTTKDFAASSYYYRRILENITPSATTNAFVISIPAGAVCYFTLPMLEENPVVSTPISGSTGSLTRATEGGDTATPPNGLSIPMSQAMVDSLSVGGEGTVLCGIYLPWSSEVVTASQIVPIATAGSSASGLLYGLKSGSVWRFPAIFDGTTSAYLANSTAISPGHYVGIAQFSANTSQMRTGLFNLTTGALTWGSFNAYRGFFPIYGTGDQQRLRYYYGGSQFPIHVTSTAWYNQILSDNEILGIIPSLTKYDPVTYIVDGNGNLIVDENGENLIV